MDQPWPWAQSDPQPGIPLCSTCGIRPVIVDPRTPRARFCEICFLRTLDLLFYELDRADEESTDNA